MTRRCVLGGTPSSPVGSSYLREPQGGEGSIAGALAECVRSRGEGARLGDQGGRARICTYIRSGVRGKGAVLAAFHRCTCSPCWMTFHSLRARMATHKGIARRAREFGIRSRVNIRVRVP
jgi:hypothetical protein